MSAPKNPQNVQNDHQVSPAPEPVAAARPRKPYTRLRTAMMHPAATFTLPKFVHSRIRRLAQMYGKKKSQIVAEAILRMTAPDGKPMER